MKKHYKIYLLLFLILVLSFSLGYAYLNSSLYINGTSIISANVWEVEFDNLNVTAGSVAAIEEPAINDTEASFTVKLTNQDDFYEFTVDVVNRGEYDAKLGSLVEITGLTTEQEQYFDYTVTYQNNEPIQVNQLVKKDEFVRLKSKVEYKENVEISQVPESAKTLKLDIKMNYDLDDGNGVEVTDNGRVKVVFAYGDINEIGTVIKIGAEEFNIISSDENHVTMLAKMNITTDSIPKQSSNAPTLAFSSSQYWDSGGLKVEYGTEYPAYVYDSNSMLYNHIENYKTYLVSQGAVVEEARLIKIEELEGLGCSRSVQSCLDAPRWVWATSYLTGSVYNQLVWYLHDDELYLGEYYETGTDYGVRPVIVIPKSEIFVSETKLIEFTIDHVTYQAEVGMTWEEWISSEYNKDNYVISGDCIMKSSGTTYKLLYYVDGTYGEIGTAAVRKNSIIVSDEYFFSNIPPDYN